MEVVAAYVLGMLSILFVYIVSTIDFSSTENTIKESSVAKVIAKAFKEGRVIGPDLSKFKISTLTVKWQEKSVTAKWFSNGSLYDLVIEGVNFPFSTREAKYILSAAQSRAKNLLLNETINKLEEN